MKQSFNVTHSKKKNVVTKVPVVEVTPSYTHAGTFLLTSVPKTLLTTQQLERERESGKAAKEKESNTGI